MLDSTVTVDQSSRPDSAIALSRWATVYGDRVAEFETRLSATFGETTCLQLQTRKTLPGGEWESLGTLSAPVGTRMSEQIFLAAAEGLSNTTGGLSALDAPPLRVEAYDSKLSILRSVELRDDVVAELECVETSSDLQERSFVLIDWVRDSETPGPDIAVRLEAIYRDGWHLLLSSRDMRTDGPRRNRPSRLVPAGESELADLFITGMGSMLLKSGRCTPTLASLEWISGREDGDLWPCNSHR